MEFRPSEFMAGVRERRPLVHHITNYVTVNDCANICICAGGSPVMTDGDDVADMVSISSSTVVNIGTLNARTVGSMEVAFRTASSKGIPMLLDPVGAGATAYRTETAEALMSMRPTVIKGNAGEIGVLSGSLIILPEKVKLHVRHTRQHIPGTRYCVVDVAGSLHTAVAAVGELFERGEIRVLIGTKSLLGEGWDSPCINALILASFVGSFVLSNQMRGRAIRIDPTHPQKVANIWHLVTVEPPYAVKERAMQRLAEQIRQDDSQLISCDYEILKRRFDTFMGPNDRTGAIESGIGRLTAIAPPYDSEGIARIDGEMLERASHREKLRAQWQNAAHGGVVEVTAQSVVPTEKRVPVFTFWNVTLFLLLAAVQADLVRLIIMTAMRFSAWTAVAVAVGEGIVCYLLYRLIRYVLLNRTPARSIRTLGTAIYEALCECSLIAPSARVECRQDKQLSYVSLYLRNAGVHDQNVFNRAMAEFLSPIDNPRYLLIRRNVLGKPSYRFSFACPSVIGKKKEYAEVLAKKLKKVGRFELVFTRREDGRRLILTCRKKSYININQRNLEQIYRVD